MGLGQVGDTPVAVGQVFEQAAPGRIRERPEHLVHTGNIGDQMVTCQVARYANGALGRNADSGPGAPRTQIAP